MKLMNPMGLYNMYYVSIFEATYYELRRLGANKRFSRLTAEIVFVFLTIGNALSFYILAHLLMLFAKGDYFFVFGKNPANLVWVVVVGFILSFHFLSFGKEQPNLKQGWRYKSSKPINILLILSLSVVLFGLWYYSVQVPKLIEKIEQRGLTQL